MEPLAAFLRDCENRNTLPGLFSLLVGLPVFRSRFDGFCHLQASRSLESLKGVWRWGRLEAGWDLQSRALELLKSSRAADALEDLGGGVRAYPLIIRESRIGVFLLGLRRRPAFLAPKEEAILPFLMVLKREVHLHNLTHLVVRDDLTGLRNKRSFWAEVRRLHACCGRYSLAAVDIDRFKHYNDTYGHPSGDHLLRRLGRILLAGEAAGGYRAYRYGGEEILLVFPDLRAQEAAVRMESIRRQVQEEDFSTDEWFFKLTISVGVADSEGCAQPEEVLARADDALYVSKRSGRNRVTVWAG